MTPSIHKECSVSLFMQRECVSLCMLNVGALSDVNHQMCLVCFEWLLMLSGMHRTLGDVLSNVTVGIN